MLKQIINVLILPSLICITLLSDGYSEPFSDKELENFQIEMGKSLAIGNGCMHCHSPKVLAHDELVPDPKRFFSGHPSDEKLPDIPEELIGPGKWFGSYTAGFTAWGGPWGVSYAANLTPDKETGIGTWKVGNFINVIRLGIHSSLTRTLMPPMPWDEIAELSDEDLKAIFKYLKTLKPIKNKVPEASPFKIDENLMSK